MSERTRLHELLVIAGLTGFAFSQPLLEVLGDNPTMFTRQRVVGTSLIVFVLVVALVPPLVLWGAGVLVSLVSRRAGDVVHLVTVGVLVALTAVQLLRPAGLEQPASLALAAVGVALFFVVGYERLRALSTWIRYTAPLPLIAVALFLLSSPAGALARDQPDVRAAGRSGPPVVFVILDEFPTRSLLAPDGGLDAVRFPRLAELAEDATWYRHYTTLAPVTTAAVPSILTGRTPTEAFPIAADHPDNLFTLLAPTHDLVVSESATALCVMEACTDPSPPPDDAGLAGLLGAAFDVWEQRVALSPDDTDPLAEFAEETEAAPRAPIPGIDSDETLEEIIDGAFARGTPARLAGFVESIDRSRASTLWYHHAMLPHQPWVTWPDGSGYREVDGLAGSLPPGDRRYPYSWSDVEATVSEQRHLLQAQHTDRLVGQVIDALRAEGLYDEALVVFIGDHGVSLEPRTSSRIATESTLDSIAYAPLFVKAPGQTAGRVDDSNMTSVDVLPTVAAEVGVTVPWEVDGYAAGSPAIAERGTTKTFYMFTDIFARNMERVVEFDDATTFPSAADRWIGPLAEGADPASGLWAALGVDDAIGRDVASFAPVDEGTATILSLDDALDPPVDAPPIGLLHGAVDDGPRQGRVLLAVDGRVVAGTRLSLDERDVPRFTLLVEPGTITTGAEVEVLVEDGGVTARLSLRG